MKNRKEIEDRITLFMTNIRKGLSYDANVVLLTNDIEEAIKQGQELPIHNVSNHVNCVGCGVELSEQEKTDGGNCCDGCWISN